MKVQASLQPIRFDMTGIYAECVQSVGERTVDHITGLNGGTQTMNYSGSYTGTQSNTTSESGSGNINIGGQNFSLTSVGSQRIDFVMSNSRARTGNTSSLTIDLGRFNVIDYSGIISSYNIYLLTYPDGSTCYSNSSNGSFGYIAIPYGAYRTMDTAVSVAASVGTYSFSSTGRIDGSHNGLFSNSGNGAHTTEINEQIVHDNSREVTMYFGGSFSDSNGQPVVPKGEYNMFLGFNGLRTSGFINNVIPNNTLARATTNIGEVSGYLSNGWDHLQLSGTVFVPVDTALNLDFLISVDVPDGYAFSASSGVKNISIQIILTPTSELQTTHSLNSADGANSGLNNMNNSVKSEFDSYTQNTDTSAQYSNISDDLLTLDVNIFTQVASTSTFFGSIVTGIFRALGDLASALTLFLVAILVSLIVGIFRNSGG